MLMPLAMKQSSTIPPSSELRLRSTLISLNKAGTKPRQTESALVPPREQEQVQIDLDLINEGVAEFPRGLQPLTLLLSLNATSR